MSVAELIGRGPMVATRTDATAGLSTSWYRRGERQRLLLFGTAAVVVSLIAVVLVMVFDFMAAAILLGVVTLCAMWSR